MLRFRGLRDGCWTLRGLCGGWRLCNETERSRGPIPLVSDANPAHRYLAFLEASHNVNSNKHQLMLREIVYNLTATNLHFYTYCMNI